MKSRWLNGSVENVCVIFVLLLIMVIFLCGKWCVIRLVNRLENCGVYLFIFIMMWLFVVRVFISGFMVR